ncbi:hypothetical protein JCM9140_3594 [Halalkalibacter wakoensis JCM 9140]|uniref:SLH domain-containing protein n=1 Tax=Halalkalibacter wakoensis JCM 9140 TaxID=1236970 RepID=W4Q642_9BACI|nr:hypothetical protein JCM9140_3594 [Halalkalibacter wakoensis JCM 9140]
MDVVSEDGSISIPVSELSNEKIRAALGLTASSTDDFEVSITIAVVSGSQATSIKNSLESRVSGASVKSDVVDFTMSVRSGEREAKLTRFDSYIFRSIPVAGVTNPQFAIAYNVDATPVIVPTQGGTESVRFASRMLSKYVVAERTPLPFTDLRADFWAKPEIDRLSVRNVFQGRSDGRVAPGESVTRVQLSVLLSRSLAMISDSEYKKQFSDVTGDEWFMDEFLPIVETGIVQGRRDGSFAPNAPVTRQQAAAMISRAMDQIGFDDSKLGTANAENTYSDFDRIDDYAKEDVERLLQAGIMEGRNDGTFGPKEPMTRAQMARVIDSLLKFQGFMN